MGAGVMRDGKRRTLLVEDGFVVVLYILYPVAPVTGDHVRETLPVVTPAEMVTGVVIAFFVVSPLEVTAVTM